MKPGAVVAWCALVVACTSSGSGPTTTNVSAAQACADNAHERCTRLQTCSPTDTVLRYGSESACETRETDSCTMSLSEPLNGNTPTAVEACAGAYAGWACADYLDNTRIPPACKQQLGPIIPGGSCAIDGQCQSGFCAILPGASCGTCAAVPKVGASCALLLGCGPGLACTTDTAKCVAFGVRGSPCGKGAVCGVALTCVGANLATGVQGTCQPAGENAGQACDPTGKTGAGCDRNAGLTCNAGMPVLDGGPDDGFEAGSGDGFEAGVEGGVAEAGVPARTCQPVVVAAARQPCGNDVGGQPVYCEEEGACIGATGSTPGTCVAAAADGAACDLAGGPGCIVPARCIGNGGTAGTCQYSGAQSCH